MKIRQTATPNVFLSFPMEDDNRSEESTVVAVNIAVTIEDRDEDDGSLVAHVRPHKCKPIEGRAVENRSSSAWLLFRLPQELCTEGSSHQFSASVDDTVLWQEEYRVVWRGRFPALKPVN